MPQTSWLAGHDVQFYSTDAFLVDIVSKFLADGARAGQPFILIATPAHRSAIAARLPALGVDLDQLLRTRDAVLLDAQETLMSFMEGGRPSAALFDATVGRIFANVVDGRQYVIVRAYGEMVDLLWREGKASAALELEDI